MNSNIQKIKLLELKKLNLPKDASFPNFSGNPNETWGIIKNNTLEAVCSFWLNNLPWQGAIASSLGHFFTNDAKSGQEILLVVLNRLQELGSSYVIGPMNGNTWQSYRLVTHSEQYPPFFLEYFTPKEWPEIFKSVGFEPIAHYSSARSSRIEYIDQSAEKFKLKKEILGLVIRPFGLSRAKEELKSVHRLSLESFSGNFLYTSILLEDFINLYEKIIPYIEPKYFLLAEHKGELVGFIFAIPDLLQKQSGKIIDTLIVKTVAKKPGRQYAGLGNYLVHAIHQSAAIDGYKNIIHALMFDDNVSRVISQKSAETIRKYALYGKSLGFK
ncbi:MAG: hypothetical protein ACKOAD_04325 [Gammaproteobacteria bacterium]